MSQCKLILDNYTGQYFPNSPIQGRVILNLDTDVTLRGVRITFICKEYTEWIGTESYYDSELKEHKSRDTQFHGDNEVLSLKQWLYGDRRGSTNLSRGQHIYPFVFNLPPNIPGTYQCNKGSITYKLIATVDRPMAIDYEDQMAIVVNSPIDLNNIARQQHLQPSHYSDEKTVCCWCCAQGPITMDVELAKKTLIPGERVKVKVHLTNMSNTNVEGVSLELKQTINYKTTDPNRDEKADYNTLVDMKDVGLGAHGENTYLFNVTLPPNVILPNFAQCQLFNVEYLYKVTTVLPSMHNNMEITMKPIVGHIPFGAQRIGEPHYNPQPPIPAAGGTIYPPVMGWTAPSAPPANPQIGDTSSYNPNYNEAPPSYDTLIKL